MTISEKELLLTSIIQSGTLENIRLFQINDGTIHQKDNSVLIIDGGIEMHFPKGCVSAAWSSDIDAFVFESSTVENIYKDSNIFELQLDNYPGLRSLLGLRFDDIQFHTKEFEFVVDYTMKTSLEELIIELILTIENKTTLQIALISHRNNEMIHNISGELLLTLNERIRIL